MLLSCLLEARFYRNITNTSLRVSACLCACAWISTEVDWRCQEIIRNEIALEFPSHYFLGEEDVPPGATHATAAIDAGLRKADWVWIGIYREGLL